MNYLKRKNNEKPGTPEHDLQDILISLEDPEGWVILTKYKKELLLNHIVHLMHVANPQFCSSLPPKTEKEFEE